MALCAGRIWLGVNQVASKEVLDFGARIHNPATDAYEAWALFQSSPHLQSLNRQPQDWCGFLLVKKVADFRHWLMKDRGLGDTLGIDGLVPKKNHPG
jgi:hypothetical protein